MPTQQEQTAIRQIVQNRSIPFLLHFTKLENLESILTHGLLPRTGFKGLSKLPLINDQYRLDNHEDAVSLSVSFPNYRMFYGCRQRDTNQKWVVLIIHPIILWESDCAFYPMNAATGKVSSLDSSMFKNASSLEAMFAEGVNGINRSDQTYLRLYDPSDVQAEVMVFGAIGSDRIRGIVFNDMVAKESKATLCVGREVYLHAGSVGFFASRSYCRNNQS